MALSVPKDPHETKKNACAPACICFVSGHGFSRAENVHKQTWALAPAGSSLANRIAHVARVSGHEFDHADNRCFVSGHGFSRAENAPKMIWALAPAGREQMNAARCYTPAHNPSPERPRFRTVLHSSSVLCSMSGKAQSPAGVTFPSANSPTRPVLSSAW